MITRFRFVGALIAALAILAGVLASAPAANATLNDDGVVSGWSPYATVKRAECGFTYFDLQGYRYNGDTITIRARFPESGYWEVVPQTNPVTQARFYTEAPGTIHFIHWEPAVAGHVWDVDFYPDTGGGCEYQAWIPGA